MHIIGDVAGRTCLVVDDMVDTAGTLCKAAQALKEHGAAKVVAYCTHAVLSGNAIDNINASVLDELVVTDTIPLSAGSEALHAHPPAEQRTAARRGGAPRQQRGIHQRDVRLMHRAERQPPFLFKNRGTHPGRREAVRSTKEYRPCLANLY